MRRDAARNIGVFANVIMILGCFAAFELPLGIQVS